VCSRNSQSDNLRHPAITLIGIQPGETTEIPSLVKAPRVRIAPLSPNIAWISLICAGHLTGLGVDGPWLASYPGGLAQL
jgi:hypothetical protein